MTSNTWLIEAYFDHLSNTAFGTVKSRREYEGLLRTLHDIPFYWTIWSDENRAGDAHAFRQYEFLDCQPDLDKLDQVWLGKWATATPSVLEVLLAMATRWSLYFDEHEPWWYFWVMLRNMGFDAYPGKRLFLHKEDEVRHAVDTWLSRTFDSNGVGSPFPVTQALDVVDMRKLEIWDQMNAYSAEHFQ